MLYASRRELNTFDLAQGVREIIDKNPEVLGSPGIFRSLIMQAKRDLWTQETEDYLYQNILSQSNGDSKLPHGMFAAAAPLWRPKAVKSSPQALLRMSPGGSSPCCSSS